MFGLMQDRQLAISSLIDYAATYCGDTEIVVRTVEGPLLRTNYREVAQRSKQVANALRKLGVDNGERVATLAWNTHRHLELYYGVSGSGAVLHTVNPRLFQEQIEYIVNHGGARILFFDIGFVPLIEKLAPRLHAIKTFVAMTDRAHMPALDLPDLQCYEELISQESAEFDWPTLDERSASALCYTSGTTGNPKGVLYSHRSSVLLALIACRPDTYGICASSCILLMVPMFHANAWGMPFAAALVGARLVMPGPHLDAEHLVGLMRSEKVNFSQAVPTVWQMLFDYFDANPEIDTRQLGMRTMGAGGSLVPRSMIERFEQGFGARFVQGWGMTEAGPIGAVNHLMSKHADAPPDALAAIKQKQGRAIWGVEIKIVDAEGKSLAHDGRTSGHLHARGPCIASGYFNQDNAGLLDSDGWLPTGDIATIDPDGYLQLVDRAKDVVKSGGEWISSMDIENVVLQHPAVSEAAVIGVFHPKWQERPLLVIVLREGHKADRTELLDFVRGRVVKWWVPDDVIFVPAMPHTATGKVLKTELRKQFKDHVLPVRR
jgi:fatty-acyl-CoA synthase